MLRLKLDLDKVRDRIARRIDTVDFRNKDDHLLRHFAEEKLRSIDIETHTFVGNTMFWARDIYGMEYVVKVESKDVYDFERFLDTCLEFQKQNKLTELNQETILAILDGDFDALDMV